MKRLDTYSQNFLRSPKLVLELIGHSSINKSDTVIDIGAGSGIISSALAMRASKVIAYEFDHRIATKLRDNLSKFDNVEIIEADFLNANLPEIPYKIFSNIPFHLSSPILKKLTEAPNRPRAIYLIVQKQFAQKLLIDKPGFTGMLGAQIAPLYETRIRRPLKKSDFWPHPAVDTVLLELKLRPTMLISEDNLETYRKRIADCFADPKAFAKMPLNQYNLLGKRPSELSTENWILLFNSYEKSKSKH
ncbi:MAG: rRNA adenine N(6)-methyltransferase family protein [Candidatus Saccharimonadales bacterium]